MAKVIDPELKLVAFAGPHQRQGHHACVVDQDVDPFVPG